MISLRPALAAALLGLGLLATAPATAAPASPAGIDRPVNAVETVQMRRRPMMRRGPMMRSRMMRRGRMMRPSSSGNARDPSRPAMQQNRGTTSGGPRY